MVKEDFRTRLRFPAAQEKITGKGVADLLLGIDAEADHLQESSVLLPIDRLVPFHEHPFRRYSKGKLFELADSIRENGVYQPVLVRELPERYGWYEILAGHNRTEASKLAGKEKIPCIIVDCNEDQAVLIVTETNLKQREKLLYSEKARAYAMQMDALRSQGKRTDLTLYQSGTKSNGEEETSYRSGTKLEGVYQSGTKFDAAKLIAEGSSDNRTNIYRYIRLNQLIEPLLDLVDEETIPFGAGVELSYLKHEEQLLIERFIASNPDVALSLELAAELRKASKEMGLTLPVIEAILEPPPEREAIRPPRPSYKKAFNSIAKYIKQLPKEEAYRFESLDEEVVKSIVLEALEKYINGR